MTNQLNDAYAKERATSGGVLIIENIAKGERKKTDVIREILEYADYTGGENLLQLACVSTDDCGSKAKGGQI